MSHTTKSIKGIFTNFTCLVLISYGLLECHTLQVFFKAYADIFVCLIIHKYAHFLYQQIQTNESADNQAICETVISLHINNVILSVIKCKILMSNHNEEKIHLRFNLFGITDNLKF